MVLGDAHSEESTPCIVDLHGHAATMERVSGRG